MIYIPIFRIWRFDINILTIDIGTYSVKFCEFRKDRKNVKLLSKHEIIIDKIRQTYSPDLAEFEIGLEIIQKYLREINFDGKLIYLLPQNFITSREFELPLSSRKKAELMIPYQLDENLPLPINDLHYASYIHKKGNIHHALVNVIQKNFLSPLYELMQEKEIMPATLTSEEFIVQSYVSEQGLTGRFCILDIGHKTSKAYFIHNKQISSTHISYTAGKTIDEVISTTYNIPFAEAIIYKHENCFLLTEEQFSEIDQDQTDFATLMDRAIAPLIQDLKKWTLGFRVKQGQPIQKILLCGGSANINNIENYITQKLEAPCKFLNKFDINTKATDNTLSYAVSNMIAVSQKSKEAPPNFLIGHYSSGHSNNLSLYSSAFIFSRVLALSCILICFLWLEQKIFISPQKVKLNRSISKLVKKESLKLPKRDQKKYRKKPKRLLSILKKKNKLIEQQIKTLMSANEKNAVTPLITLSQFLTKNEAIDLSSFESRDGIVHATFSAKKKNDLKKLMEHLKTAPFTSIKFDLQENILSMNFEE